MKDLELHILRHSLGYDDAGNGREYRNHYAIGPESEPEFSACQALCNAGLMEDAGKQRMWGGLHGFRVTDAGKAKVRELAPPPKKLTRSQQRYRTFLRSDSGMSFGEWLKWEAARSASDPYQRAR